ncbi:MAG: molybdopterin-dependent oxidoreductase [Dehalococcoidia bacterium]
MVRATLATPGDSSARFEPGNGIDPTGDSRLDQGAGSSRERDGLHAALDRGSASAALAVLLGWAMQVAGAPSPFEPVAEAIMARTPPEFANHLLGWLGFLARPAALLGAVAVYLVIVSLASVAGCIPLRLHAGGRLLISALAGITFAGAAARWLGLPLIGEILVLLAILCACASERIGSSWRRSAPQAADLAPSRRRLIHGSLLTALLVLLSANAVFLSALYRAMGTTANTGRRLFGWSPPPPRVDGFDQLNLGAEVTSAAQFYVMGKNVDDPAPNSDSWRLTLRGHAGRLLRLDYNQLLALPRVDQYVTLRCISNDIGGHLMSTALFSGVTLAALLQRVGLAPDADTVVMRAVDGHEESLPLAVALRPDVIVAYAMNGMALSREHGFPARVVVPGLYGFRQVKWLSDLHFSRGPYLGHWEKLGWTTAATVHTVARIDLVRTAADGVEAAGFAFAGDRGISGVQVRVDGGPWAAATLNAPPLSSYTWLQWRALLPSRRGVLEARAIDGDGRVQEEQQHSLFPDGATGFHHVRFVF